MSRHAKPLHISKDDIPKSLGGSKSDTDDEIEESSASRQQGNTHGQDGEILVFK